MRVTVLYKVEHTQHVHYNNASLYAKLTIPNELFHTKPGLNVRTLREVFINDKTLSHFFSVVRYRILVA